ncbi:uncharacterized protein TNCV_3101031 [Trichonephila clavipes]|nr:uncharacterized protein TNCV_3101031 [Trichonephila clavipes]
MVSSRAHWKTEWRSVVFPDEIRFSLGASDGLMLVTRRPGEACNQKCLRPRHAGPTSRVVAAVAEWYRYRTVACFVTGSSPVPLKTRRVGQRCTLNLSRAETSSRWCGVVVRRGASSGVVHVT